MNKIDGRLSDLETTLGVKPKEEKTFYVWIDPETGEYRNDKPPDDYYQTDEWLKVKYEQN